jgi:hypothetical protein
MVLRAARGASWSYLAREKRLAFECDKLCSKISSRDSSVMIAGFKGWFGGAQSGGGAAAIGSGAGNSAPPADEAVDAADSGVFDPDADESEEDA